MLRSQPRRVVITGMGVVTALGETLDSFLVGPLRGPERRRAVGLCSTRPNSRSISAARCAAGTRCARFGVKEARHLDRFAQFAMAASIAAVDDSGIDFTAYPPHASGVIIGSGIGGLNEFETQHTAMMTKGPSRISPFTIPKLMVNAASGQVSIRWGLQGRTRRSRPPAPSAANAIGDAFKMIQNGQADVMITGGSEAAITHMGLGGFAVDARPLHPKRRPDPRQPTVRPRPRWLRPRRGGRDPRDRGRGDRARVAARGSTPRFSVTGCRPTAPTSPLPTKKAEAPARAMRLCLEDGAARTGIGRLHQRPRHQHRPRRPRRNQGDESRLRKSRPQARRFPARRANLATSSGHRAASS